MKKILIVDDEEAVRRLLGNVLRKHGFMVTSAENGMEAIGMAVSENPDLILMDLDMPKLDGVGAIRKLKQQGSSVPILVLTGKATKQNIRAASEAGADGILVKNQFDLKPFMDRVLEALESEVPTDLPEPEPSKRTPKARTPPRPTRPSRESEPVLRKEDVEKRLHAAVEMKALPFVASELVKLASSSHSDTRQLAATIERDQALTARILKLANSAFFAQHGRVQTVHQAVSNIGYDSVRQLAVAVTLVDEYRGKRKNTALSRVEFWKHSLGTAVLCRDLAAALEWEPGKIDDAFLAGLLHDMGQALLDDHFQEEYAAVLASARKRSVPVHEVEQELMGLEHTEVPSVLIQKWKLPDSLQGPVRWHHASWHDVMQNARLDHALVALVRLGDTLVNALGIGTDEEDMLEPLQDGLLQNLRIPEEAFRSVVASLHDKVQELTQILLIHDGAAPAPRERPIGRSLRLALVDPLNVAIDPMWLFLERVDFNVTRVTGLPDDLEENPPPIILLRADSIGWLDEVLVRLDKVKMKGRRPQFLILSHDPVPKGLRGRWSQRDATFAREPVSMRTLSRLLSKISEA